MSPTLKYEGIDRSGRARTGRGNALSAAEFVESAYQAGWRRLSVKDDSTGRVVAKIGRKDGARVWWAEG